MDHKAKRSTLHWVFVWILDTPRIIDETNKSFVKRTISAGLPDPESEPEPFELVQLCQIRSHSRTFWKYI